MLTHLSIRDVVTIQNLDIEFNTGFSVLTGETGAGKSILLDSLSLILGMRGDVSLIRPGQEQASVTAVFHVPENEALNSFLAEQDIPFNDHTLVIRRNLHVTAKSKAFINDQLVSVSFLKDLGSYLVDIHGQFDTLLQPDQHRFILDQFCRQTNAAFLSAEQSYQQAFKAYQAAKLAYSSFCETLNNTAAQAAFYTQMRKDFDQLNPLHNEEADLREKRESLSHHAKVTTLLNETLRLLKHPYVCTDVLSNAYKLIEKGAAFDATLAPVQDMLDRCYIELTEAVEQIERFHDKLSDATQVLQEIDERLYALRTVTRKYQLDSALLYEHWQELIRRAESTEDQDSKRDALKKALDECDMLLKKEALMLQTLREKGAKALEKTVNEELPALKLPEAVFNVCFTPKETAASYGITDIFFYASINKGHPVAPLHKTASGGELSRLMLALKVATASTCLKTYIFDEIDAGVGGAAAAAIGDRLKRLGHCVQTLAVTHSPQVAACASTHFIVHKKDAQTSVTCLSDDKRIEEIARMLAGDHITEEARAAARKLIA